MHFCLNQIPEDNKMVCVAMKNSIGYAGMFQFGLRIHQTCLFLINIIKIILISIYYDIYTTYLLNTCP